MFRPLWIANVASGIGSALHDTAAVWTMTTLTHSATLVTLMQSMSSLPLFLLALPAGALADILDRRKVLLAAQTGALVVTAGLALLSWAGYLSPIALLAVTFLLGVGVSFTIPTWQALLAEIVGRQHLTSALTLGSIAVNVSRALGPVFAGLLLAVASPTAAFALNALSFLGIIVVLWRTHPPASARSEHPERMWGALAASLRFTRHSPVVRSVLTRNATFTFFGIASVALLPLIVRGRGLAAADFGALMGAYGMGGILAAIFLLPILRRRFDADGILFGATVILAALAAVLALEPHRLTMEVILLGAGAAWMTGMSALAVAAQSAYPNWVRARSSATQLIVVQGSMAGGALAWGQVTAHSHSSTAMIIASCGLLATLLLGRIHRIGHAMTVDVTPSDHWGGHQLPHEPGDDEGPIAVTLEYEIDPEKALPFQRAMERLRRVRLRDGAFRWSLLQDLENPSQYREAFVISSWGEHLRQHARATRDDRSIEDAAQAFHIGPVPPRVRHHLMVVTTQSQVPPLKPGEIS